MTADERLSLIRVKVERAKEHIRNLQIVIKSFFESNPYVVGTKRDPQTRQLVYYVVRVAPTSPAVAMITGDALQNLRASLDHLAYQLFLVGTGGNKPGNHIYFPIADDAAKYKSSSAGKVQGMRQEAIKAINAIKPYKGGNDALWRLHKLNNIDKHRLILTVGSAFREFNIGAYMIQTMRKAFPESPKFPDLGAYLRPADNLCPLKAGDELFIGAPDDEVNEKMDFRFDIAIHEPQIIEGEPLLPTLQQMADLVDNLILTFKPLLG